jgi:hypothetical protein
MSDTHTPAHRYIIRRALTPGYDLWHVIDTDTDLSYGCFAHDSARRLAARLNEKES